MADVALVPERHVLQGDQRVAAQQAGESGHALGEHRVALVRHGRGTLLPGPERLECLRHLGALQVADLGRDAFERSTQDRNGGEQVGMPITAHHLGGGGVGLKPEPLAHEALRLGADVGMAADGAGQLAHADLVTHSSQPILVTGDLRIPAGGLEAEGDRLGMDPVAAPDHGRVTVLQGKAPRDLRQAGQLSLDHHGRIAQGDRGGRVEHVRAGEAVVQPAALRAKPLGDRSQECENVVL